MTELFIVVTILSLSVVAILHAARFLKKMVGKDQAWSRVKPAKNMPVTLPMFVAVFLIAVVLSATFYQINQVKAQSSGLSVEILAGYNLVVDSNVQSPSTMGPSAATVSGRVCNTTGTTLTNVVVNIGDYTGGGSGTPGIYPSRDSTQPAFQTEHPALANSGSYAFTHEGGSLGLSDASRNVGDLGPGQCTTQYWTFSYPRCENSEEPPCSGDATWGDSVKPEDDLHLDFDVWATSDDTTPADATWTMWMRNEISAMANKIQPNGNPGGLWFNTDPATIVPGGIITTNGILYRIGNVRFGFDNDGDYLPDYNFWVQPFGDPGGLDPGCFRLIRTSGVITVEGQGATSFTFEDQLYFTYPDVPPDNTNVIGEVFYTYVALGSNCSITPSPYQEAASGYDNEKFNADYGAGGTTPMSVEQAEVTIDKSGNPDMVNLGAVITYTIPFANQSATESAGLTFYSGAPVNNPLVISDSIPAGTEYIAGSATYNLGSSSVSIRYSTDNGQTWQDTEPPAASVTTIQWWLDDALPPGVSGTASFAVGVPLTYSGPPVIDNCANAQFGEGASIGEACDTTLVIGNNSIGDYVWQDDNANGLQDDGATGLDNISVTLYYDADGNGELDISTDVFITDTVTTGGGNYLFDNLPDGNFLVQVDRLDSDRPVGYSLTTQEIYAVDLDSGSADSNPVDYQDADFGFGPALSVEKTLLSSEALEGKEIQYRIDVANLRPGDGTGQTASCSVDFWAGTSDINATGNPDWTQTTNGGGEPDGSYALGNFAGNGSALLGDNFTTSALPGNIVSVEAIYSLYVDTTGGTLGDDVVQGNIYSGTIATVLTNTTFTNLSLNALSGAANQGIYSWDITGARTNWEFTDFSNLLVEMYINKTAGADGAIINLDALGFRITTDSTCGKPSDTLNPVPLSDTFNADLLEFVSADPPHTTVTTGLSGDYPNTGLIEWTNIGPLYAGQTKEIIVTFIGKESSLTAPTTLTNTATVTNAYFISGEPANDGEDDATTTLTPTGTITGVVWSDSGTYDGWSLTDTTTGYESDDSFIPYATVNLYQCINIDSTPDYTRDCTAPANGGSWQLVATATTAADGSYIFDGLIDGYYYVWVDATTILGGATLSNDADPDNTNSANRCIDVNDCSDTDGYWNHPDAELDQTTPIDVAGGIEIIPNINFGYNTQGAIFGTVWEDVDGDGVQEDGEGALVGSVVSLFNGVTTSTVTIDATGAYSFTNLSAGAYTITVTTPGGATWVQTVDPDDLDSNYSLTLTSGEISGSHDFAYAASGPYTLGDTVYIDWDGDGTQDTAEPGIENITVYLYEDEDGDGVIDSGVDALITTTATSAGGFYQFANLPSDNYIVVVDIDDPDFPLTAGQYAQTQDYDSTLDSRAVVSLTASIDTADFGYQPVGTASIGDTVWKDMDANGIQSGSQETGIANIGITLYVDVDGDGVLNFSQDAVISTTVTNANGNYLFENLISATYFVDVDTGDSDLVINGSMYQLTTNNDPLTVTLTTGQSYLDADFGFAPPATIGDTIYQDNNRNGQYDVGEPGIQGVTVELYVDENNNGIYDSGTDTLYDTDVTDANGNYLFTDLPSDLYIVVVDENSAAISGWQQTGDPDHFAVCEDPDTNGFTYDDCNAESAVLGFTQDMHGNTLVNPIRLGQTDLTRDFGYLPPRAIGDRVWLDYLGDGIDDYNGDGQDDEPGLGGVDVQLIFGGSVIATTTTDSEGYYGFGGDILNNDGAYTIRVVTTTLPATMTQTYDLDNVVLDHQTTVTITSSPYFTNVIDFGYRYAGPYSITGTVFFDQGNIGDTLTDTFTSGDTPYANITVYLFDENRRQIDETTTDASGHYTFTNLFGGGITYTVSVDITDSQIAGQILTASPDGVHSYYSVNITSTDVGDIDFGFFEDRPILNISKSVNPTGEISPGDTLTYTITVSNSGTLTATNVVISDTLPAEVSANAITVTITPPGNGTVSTTPPALVSGVTITPGETITLTVVVTADLGLAGGTIITNTASVTSSEVLTPVVSPPVTNTIPYTADLEIVKTDDPDPVVPGGILTYTLVYTNNGPGNAQNVTITDTLPVSVTFGGVVSENPAISGPTQTGQLLTWFTPTLVAGATGELVYTVTVDSAVTQTFTNSVSITSTTTDGNPNNNDDDEPTDIQTADLSLDKSVDNTTPNVGEVITFTIVVNNAGPQNATNVEVVDVVPAGYNTITNISSGGIESGNVITWSGLGITAGQSITLSFRAAVAATGPYTNLAQITAVDQYDIDSTPDNGVDTDGDGNEVDDSGDEDDGDGAVVTPPATATIGDYVWGDLDHDGIQDVGEAGVSGITVTLYLSGSPVATTTTDASGIYTFTNVTSNTYSVRFTAPGYSFTQQDQGGNDAADSDVNGIGWTTPITVSAGDVITSVDAGLWQPATIGDYVWNDLDHDGQQDASELGLPNVQVVLLSGGTPVATTTTNASGIYTFTNVVSGSYTVHFTAPSGYAFTQQDQGSNLTDSDADSSGQTASFSVNAGQTLSTIDAGLWQPVTIGGQVRDDGDADGDPSDADNPLSGVTVVLYSGSTPVMTTTTNGSGYYTFTNVVSGSYTIRETDPSGYASTYDTGGANDNQIPVTVNAGQTSADNDFLDTQPATVGDYVWNDLDHDGQQDAGEPGLPNVQVVLLSGGTPVATTTTSSSGLYTFTNVVSGSYTVEFSAPSGYAFTQQDQGSNLTDSDADSSGQTASFSVNAGQTLDTIDAGLWQPVMIGDYVWNDLDHDGQQDAGEPGLPNVQVVLLSGGTPVATTTTSSSGLYTLTNVVSGSYTVEFSAPSGYAFTQQDQGSNLTDSDADSSGQTASFSVNAGQTLSTIDAGLYQPATIGDYVWNDLDNDGQQEVGELGLPNVQVVLLSGGTPVATTTTSSSGLYTFTNVVSGSYTVQFTAPSGYDFTQQDQGSNLSDSDADSSGQTSSFTVNAGQTLDTIDAGLWQPATIGDYVWNDLDNDGQQEVGELGLPNVQVVLLSGGTPVATTTTSSSGLYTFTNVVSGSYTIEFTAPAGYAFTRQDQGSNLSDSDADSSGQTASFSVNAGQTLNTIDAGLWQPATIGDYVWNDLDHDGQQDGGEPGLPNVQVVLLSGGTPVATTTTNAGGIYTFTNVVSGSYTIEFTAPVGYDFTQQDQGSNLTDSDADSSGQTASFSVNAGQTLSTIDAGLWQPATIGGRVLEDTDDSGDFSGSDTPLPGITIRLYEDANGDGNPDSATPVATQTTSSSGYYTFTNVVSGTYVIVETDLVTYTSVTDTQGANDNRVSVSVNAGDTSTGNDFLDIPQGPAIEIAKTPDTQTIEYNGTVTFTITITNIGNVVLSPVEVIDIVSPDCTTGYGSLNPGWSESYTCVVTNVTANFINTAIVSGTSPTNDVVTDTDNAAVDVLVPAIGLAKSVGTVINNGDGTHNVSYTLVVENLGDVTLNNVTITDDLSITFAGSGGFAVVAGPTATTPLAGNVGYDGVTNLDLVNAGTLGVSQVATVTFTVQVTQAGNMGPYTNTAYVEGVSPAGNPVDDQSDDGTDPDPDGDGDADEPGENDPTPVLFTQSGLSITKTLTSNSPVLVGQPVEFDIVIQNTGNITLTTVPVTDTYDTDYLAFVSASSSVDDATDDGQLNWSNVGPINPGESVTITVSFTAEQAVAGTTNTAAASATDDNGDNVPEQTDNDTVEIIRLGLDVNKSVSIARVAPNQVVTYTIDITNTGTVTLTSVIVTDTLENGLTYQLNSASPTQPSVNGQELVWTLTGGLPAGDTTRITFRASVTTTTGSYQNFVLAEGVHPTGTITDTDNVPVTVEDPTVAIDKGVVPPGVVDGLITFTIRITNTGPSTLDQVPLFDHFTGPVEYYSASPEPDNVDNANGTLSWNDLTQNNTHGFGRNLDPGEAFEVTTVFRLTTTDQQFSMTNEATVTSDTGNPAVDVLNNDANEPSDRVDLVNEPTAITLLYFAGDRVGDNVVLNWATAVEINNFGFKLMRSTTGDFTDAVEIAFVNGQGSGTASGASYTYTDNDVAADQTYTYWLVDLDNDGTHTIHDPITVEPTTLDGGGNITIFLPLIFK